MHLPDYKGGSIVNLMSSILRACGASTVYKPLRRLDIEALRRSTNIILMVVDGLGYDYLKHQGAATKLRRHLAARMTSVFPSTTATGITTFATGVAPQQHAITGWFMALKEIGSVVRILPFDPRHGGAALDSLSITAGSIIGHDTIFGRIERSAYCLTPSYLCGSAYTQATSRGAESVGFDSLEDCLVRIRKIIGSSRDKRYIYAYWPEFDTLCHGHGTGSEPALAHLQNIDREIERFVGSIRGTRTTLLITADHGLVDTTPDDRINMREHPILNETLSMPLCGEPRVAYCYVRPSKTAVFRRYVRTRLADQCDLYESRDLIKRGFFGLHEANRALFHRVGDYVLVMKRNYVLRDFIRGENEHFLAANHGGVTSSEMHVPLIHLRC